MNVDEAMEAAAEFRADREARPAWTLFSETVAVVLAKEVERLRAELELSKANAESLKKALHEVQNAAIRLGDQVDDAKAELAAAKADGAMVEATVAENQLLRVTNERLAADLAAAKAARVCPLKSKSVQRFFKSGADLGNQWGIEFWFDTKEQRDKFGKWMKGRGEG